MATINKNLKVLNESDILAISEHYLMGWHDLEKEYGFRIKSLNNERAKFGLKPLDKNISFDYRIAFIKNHYTRQEIYDIIDAYLQHNRVADERWSGIYLFDCRFGRDYVKAFRSLLGSSVYRKLSEKYRVKKSVETQVGKYGGVGLAGDATRSKAQTTVYEHYGVLNPMQSDEVKNKLTETNTPKFGGMSPFSSITVREKAAETKIMRIYQRMQQFIQDGDMPSSDYFGSTGEIIMFMELVNRFGRQDVMYQYGIHPADKRYPFNCDFYIKSLDLFIELNSHYSHHTHWFDANNPNDINRRDMMSKTGKKRSINAVKVWCETDVKKRETAKMNQLRYLVFWDESNIQINKKRIPALKDFYIWFEEYECDVDAFLKDYPQNTY